MKMVDGSLHNIQLILNDHTSNVVGMKPFLIIKECSIILLIDVFVT
jgi:hypothetical protein